MARAGAPPPEHMHIPLGSATWFNEPVIRCLVSLAPAVEALLEATRRGDVAEFHSGEPPLAVFCLTDGMDNLSPPALGSLHSLISAIGGLVGPTGGRPLYEPLSPLERGSAVRRLAPPSEGGRGMRRSDSASVAERVPVWLTWVVLGEAGRQFTEAPQPSAITLVDATPLSSRDGGAGELEAACSRAVAIDGGEGVQPGQLVLVHQPAGAVVPTAAREAVVLDVEDAAGEGDAGGAQTAMGAPRGTGRSLVVLYVDRSGSGVEHGVSETRCQQIVPHPSAAYAQAPSAATSASSRPSAEATLALVDAALNDPRSLAHAAKVNGTGCKVVPASTPVPPVEPERLRAVCSLAAEAIEPLSYGPLPQNLVIKLMVTLGRAARTLDAADRAVAQRIASAAVAEITAGRTVLSGHFYEHFGGAAAPAPQPHSSSAPRDAFQFRRRASSTTAADEAAAKREEALCAPALALLERLTELGVVKANERSFGCSRPQCACSAKLQQAFTAWDPNMPSLAAAQQLVHPAAGDSIARCVEHYHRAYPYRAKEASVVERPD
mmetsp:Transcript_72825/g.199836  ORF Transcript_72825/g.199836 Transcript_72825/m.199836 type:complete len:549 (-) Transcript_72825:327-1973(-)